MRLSAKRYERDEELDETRFALSSLIREAMFGVSGSRSKRAVNTKQIAKRVKTQVKVAQVKRPKWTLEQLTRDADDLMTNPYAGLNMPEGSEFKWKLEELASGKPQAVALIAKIWSAMARCASLNGDIRYAQEDEGASEFDDYVQDLQSRSDDNHAEAMMTLTRLYKMCSR